MPPISRKYYDALGVSTEADNAEIRRGYKKAALRWHPDRNPDNKEQAEAKFKEISEAFEVLSDPQKRRVYDQVGEDGMKGGGGMPPGGFPGGAGFPGGGTHFTFQSGGAPGGFGGGFGGFTDPRKLFEQLFSESGGPFGGGGGGGGAPFPFMGMGMDMGGMGGMGGFQNMGGMGMGGFPGMGGPMGGMGQQRKGATREFPLNCSLEELYEGKTKKVKITRKRLNPRGGVSDEAKVIEVEVKRGWKEGTKVTFPGEGDEDAMTQAGDIVFVLKEKPHGIFKRQGENLVFTAEISRDKMQKPLQIPYLDGTTVTVTPGNIRHGESKVISGKGMPKRSQGKEVGKGNLVVIFSILD
eukprot:Hpha_TRINITY_DN13181_c0_g2::TRINITY_DN13181_c0_g2_i1::g.113398::m.113398/K09510/DNAJB4; DnaJ homolog subfamily B member 4